MPRRIRTAFAVLLLVPLTLIPASCTAPAPGELPRASSLLLPLPKLPPPGPSVASSVSSAAVASSTSQPADPLPPSSPHPSVPSSSVLPPGPALQRGSGPSHGGRVVIGRRSFDEDDWAPVEDQWMIGFDFDMRPRNSPVGIEAGFAFSAETEEEDVFVPGFGTVSADLTGSTSEFYVGALFTMPRDATVRPYAGVGLSLIRADLELDTSVGSASVDDLSLAGYAHGGVAFLLGRHFELGADVRTLFGSDMEIEGFSVDADYVQFALTFGYRF